MFEEVKPEEFPNFREGHRGRVSYPIVKGFMESGYRVAKLDRSGMNRSAGGLKGLLSYYCGKHHYPIKFLTRQGELYFVRLDINEDGTPNPDWEKEQLPPDDTDEGIPSMSPAEIDSHE